MIDPEVSGVLARLLCARSQLCPPEGALCSLERDGGEAACAQPGSRKSPGCVMSQACQGPCVIGETLRPGPGEMGPWEWGPWGDGSTSARSLPSDSTGWGPFSQCKPTCPLGLHPLPTGRILCGFLGHFREWSGETGRRGYCWSPETKTKGDLMVSFFPETTFGKCQHPLIDPPSAFR